ncbi:MAG: septal ring lytic transglycosylase RlpA family protein [bacterium]|nr:septal ring lytic transglycosylase RlpA family protein [bacterium]
MLLNNKAWLLVGGTSLFLVSCGAGDQEIAPPAAGLRPVTQAMLAPDTPVKIGPPYDVKGVTYTPEDAPNYDEVGYATWYGAEAQGQNTASGEPFMATAITAAHKTLPLPSYVEVTALDTGRTILVRINDRGPFTNDKIIDLSRGAAEQLGILGDSAAAVRVRRVTPPEQERAVLRGLGRAAERLETPPSLLKALRNRLGTRPVAMVSAPVAPLRHAKPDGKAAVRPHAAPSSRQSAPAASADGDFVVEQAGEPTAATIARPVQQPAPPRAAPIATAVSGGYVVQVAAFASQSRAEALARRIGASALEAGGVWRVRFGPYPTQGAAEAGVKVAASKGFENARIMANDAR